MDLNELFPDPDACDYSELTIRDLPMTIDEALSDGVLVISITLNAHTASHLAQTIEAGIRAKELEADCQNALEQASIALEAVIHERQTRSFLVRLKELFFPSREGNIFHELT